MKKIYYPFLFVWAVFASCNDYLDVVPDNVATLDHAFVDRMSAEKFLATCYSYLPDYGSLASDPAITGSDETWIHTEASNYSSAFGKYYAYNIKRGQQNVTEPLLNYWDGDRNGTNLFTGIRDCNIFLENIHKVGKDLEDSERARWIAEVKFLKAYYHYYLVRMYGPVPLIRENLPISAGIDEVRVFRESVDECFSYIVQLIDEAVPGLPLEVGAVAADLGHITQPVALALKAEILVTAASPLFNGNSAYSGFADSRGVQLFNPNYDENKWKLAMDACKNAIDTALLANNRLYIFNDPRYTLSETTARVMSLRNAFAEKWNEEVIWGFTENTTQQLQQYTLPYFALTDQQLTHTSPVLSPTMTAAELFYSENGVPINEDTGYDYANRYSTSAASGQGYYISDGFVTANLNQRREPRFYACLGFDGAIWYGNGRYKDVGQGTSTETPWIVRAKAGEMSGKTSSIRYSATGYFLKKYPHFETATSATAITYVRMAFPVMRLADLYLLYAEARNEYLGPDAEVYHYLDLVRERAGLQGVVESWAQYSRYPDKPLSKEGLREIIHQERTCELAFEGKRFWDLRRWKTADQVMNQVVKGWNVNGTAVADYYSVVSFESLQFMTREYLWPLKQQTLRVNPNLVQNPFWEN
jgi:hypothetical protein